MRSSAATATSVGSAFRATLRISSASVSLAERAQPRLAVRRVPAGGAERARIVEHVDDRPPHQRIGVLADDDHQLAGAAGRGELTHDLERPAGVGRFGAKAGEHAHRLATDVLVGIGPGNLAEN